MTYRDDTPLTPRQREILMLVAEGYTDGEIAVVLGIAAQTVRNHMVAIRSKLRRSAVGAQTRVELANYYWWAFGRWAERRPEMR